MGLFSKTTDSPSAQAAKLKEQKQALEEKVMILEDENATLKTDNEALKKENAILRNRLAKYADPVYKQPCDRPVASGSGSVILQDLQQHSDMLKRFSQEKAQEFLDSLDAVDIIRAAAQKTATHLCDVAIYHYKSSGKKNGVTEIEKCLMPLDRFESELRGYFGIADGSKIPDEIYKCLDKLGCEHQFGYNPDGPSYQYRVIPLFQKNQFPDRANSGIPLPSDDSDVSLPPKAIQLTLSGKLFLDFFQEAITNEPLQIIKMNESKLSYRLTI